MQENAGNHTVGGAATPTQKDVSVGQAVMLPMTGTDAPTQPSLSGYTFAITEADTVVEAGATHTYTVAVVFTHNGGDVSLCTCEPGQGSAQLGPPQQRRECSGLRPARGELRTGEAHAGWQRPGHRRTHARQLRGHGDQHRAECCTSRRHRRPDGRAGRVHRHGREG